MFPIDVALLPSLTTRKALLVVDAQNDFLAEDGALPIRMPVDLPQRISDLAGDFRRSGSEIIWVQSRFEDSRPIEAEQIMISDTPSSFPGSAPAPRGRRPRATPQAAETTLSPEAFLTLGAEQGPSCVRLGTPGAEMHPIVKQAVGPKDHVLTKTFYSAFKVDELLRVLRVRFVTELFICGSSTNIGVMATAVDAASYGYTITIVDDCCGSQSMSRHRTALRQIASTTGCDTLSADNVLDTMRPKPKPATSERGSPRQGLGVADGRSPTVRLRRGKKDAVASSVSEIQPSLERLSLSGEPAAADERASKTPATQQQQQQQQQQPQSRSRSQSRPRSAVQPVARPSHAQTKNQRDRDTVGAVAPTDMQPSAINGRASGATRRSATASHKSDGGRNDSAHSDAVVGADPRARGSTSSSKRRSQQSTPPPSAAPSSKLQPRDNPNANANVNANANTSTHTHTAVDNSSDQVHGNVNGKRNVAKGVESPKSTSDASSPGSSKASSESRETPPTPINTLKDDATASPSTGTGQTSSTMGPLSEAHAEGSPLCEGDTKVVYDILPPSLEADIFARIRDEVSWQHMSHQGGEVPRLVAVQGAVARDGSKPVYRHPADSSPPLRPFTAAVDEVRAVVEAKLGHPLNHVLIQLYRGGNDYISEHSDKTLDIARDSFIANVSLGAERTMTLRTKRQPKTSGGDKLAADADALKRQVQRARLPHNSLFQMGLATNMRWLHAIRADKRLAREKTEAERAHDGARISLTFRRIGTFLDGAERVIWGQGATGKTRARARPVVNGQTAQAVAMLKAFGRENQDAEFDWAARYGAGFDVLHIGDAKRLFLSGDAVVDLRVRVMLAELGVSYARGSLAGENAAATAVAGAASSVDVPIKFVDNDGPKTAVAGQKEIMLYLQNTYGGGPVDDKDRVCERWKQGLRLLDSWRECTSTSSPSPTSPSRSPPSTEGGKGKPEAETTPGIKHLLAPWEQYATEDAFIAGPTLSLADFAFWPVLHDIFLSPLFAGDDGDTAKTESKDQNQAEATPKKASSELPHLRAYYDRVRRREPIAQLLGAP